MRIALFGGTGFVGSYLLDALLQAGMQPAVLVRPGHESRLRHRDRCDVVSGNLEDPVSVDAVLRGAEAVIYNIGILREFPARGITFEELHYHAVKRIMQAAERAGVKRFVLMRPLRGQGAICGRPDGHTPAPRRSPAHHPRNRS